VLLCLVPALSAAADFKLSGFGTLGYAISDQSFPYLRYIDNGGSIAADSLIGLQGEAQFNSQWGATVQAVASAPRTSDQGVEAKIRWAFVSFRPDNDWLFRVGRLRPPFLLYSQNAEVGVTYEQVRLPQELYSLSPVYDFDGGAVTKTWSWAKSETTIDAYWGKTDLKVRLPVRDDSQATYVAEKVTAQGLILSHTTGPLMLRVGANRANIVFPDQSITASLAPTTIPVPAPVGGTVYQPTDLISKINLTVLTFGADWRPGEWRLTAEYAQRIIQGTDTGPGGKSGYVTAARQIGKWTPYATYARLLSDGDTRALYQTIRSTPVPLAVQLAPPFLPANYHRALANNILVSDQYSVMLGTSYSFSATSKLKLELMQTHIGLASTLVDSDVQNKRLNVFSASYSVAF